MLEKQPFRCYRKTAATRLRQAPLAKITFTLFYLVAIVAISHSSALSHKGRGEVEGSYHQYSNNADHRPGVQSTPRSNTIAQQHNRQQASLDYRRGVYRFKTYKYPPGTVSFYIGKANCKLEVEHVVALKDAHQSGAKYWSSTKKIRFANDKLNHRPACSHVNRSKGASTPYHFLRKSRDGKGTEYDLSGSFCGYLSLYQSVKNHYGLSFENNRRDIFSDCGLNIDTEN